MASNSVGLLRLISRPQFGFRTLFLATAVVAICATMVRHARERQAAVSLIRAYGGSVAYDFQERPTGTGVFDRDAHSAVPRWIVNALGDDMIADVILVEIDYNTSDREDHSDQEQFPDTIALQLAAFYKLEYLFIHGNVRANDRMLESIGDLTNLRLVVVEDGRAVTDGGISNMLRLQQLVGVTIFRGSPSITDESLKTLARLRSLQYIECNDCRITDRGVKYLQGMPALKVLRLSRTNVEMGHDAVSSLSSLQALEELNVSAARVTSRVFKSLAPLQHLRVLNLSGNIAFADDGMPAVARLTNLEELKLNGTRVTPHGMRYLVRLKKLRAIEPPVANSEYVK